MDSIETTFTALSRRMTRLSPPAPIAGVQPSLSSLIDRVNAAKQHYQPGLRRQAFFARNAITMPTTANRAPDAASPVQR